MSAIGVLTELLRVFGMGQFSGRDVYFRVFSNPGPCPLNASGASQSLGQPERPPQISKHPLGQDGTAPKCSHPAPLGSKLLITLLHYQSNRWPVKAAAQWSELPREVEGIAFHSFGVW